MQNHHAHPLLAFLSLIILALAFVATPLPAQDTSTKHAEPPTPPKIIEQIPPVYPKTMKRSRIAGAVTLEFLVNTNGDVESPTVVSSNNPAFEQPAINAILQWKFKPGTKDGKAVARRMRLPIKFTPTAHDVAIQPAVLFDTTDKPDTPPVLRDPYINYPENMAKAGTQGYVIVALTTYPHPEKYHHVAGTNAEFEKSVRDSIGHIGITLDKPAQARGKNAPSYSWTAVIFNPASTAPDTPNATINLLKVAPVILTSSQWKSLPKNEKILRGSIAVDASGAPQEITLETKSASAQALLPDIRKSVAQWAFAPARANGQPVASVINTVFVPLTVPATISSIKGNTTPPIPLDQPAPVYPYMLKDLRIEGEVVLHFIVNADGKTTRITVMSSTHRGFEAAAVSALREWRFKPGMISGVPVTTRIMLPISFRLSD